MVKQSRVFVCGVLVCLLGRGVFGFQPPSQSEFVPVTQASQMEQLPAAPLVIAAYAFVWTALIVYLWSIWRRIGKVEADMRALGRRSTERSSAR